jgi:seryl-tRNA synthetase
MLSRDVEKYKSVQEYLQIYKKIPADFNNYIAPVIGGMTYAQCIPFWTSITNKMLNHKAYPIRFYDYSGASYRYEGNAIHSLERLDGFNRIESIFIDTAENLPALCIKFIDKLRNFFIKLELTFRVVAVESWLLAECCCANTTDIELYIPFNDKWLETVNVSNNSDHYLKSLNVKASKLTHSGCSGLGLDRLVYSFLHQKGFDPENWPKIVKDEYNSSLINNWIL